MMEQTDSKDHSTHPVRVQQHLHLSLLQRALKGHRHLSVAKDERIDIAESIEKKATVTSSG